jgi:hypothetical protein
VVGLLEVEVVQPEAWGAQMEVVEVEMCWQVGCHLSVFLNLLEHSAEPFVKEDHPFLESRSSHQQTL